MSKGEHAYGPRVSATIEGWISYYAGLGTTFTSDQIRQHMERSGAVEARPRSFGRFFTAAQQRKQIERVGDQPSKRGKARGRRVSVWRGATK